MTSFFRGSTQEQDGRFGKADRALMDKMARDGKFAPVLSTKVNLKKVNLDVISQWVTKKIIELVGFEDDILIGLVINLLQGDKLDAKKLQLDVTGFLAKQAPAFVEELWSLLVDAQDQKSGIPSVFIQEKLNEIQARQNAQDVANRIASETIMKSEPEVRTSESTDKIREDDHRNNRESDSKIHERDNDKDRDRHRRRYRSESRSRSEERNRRRDRDRERDRHRDRDRYRDIDRDSDRDRDRERERDRDRDRDRRRDRDRDRSRERGTRDRRDRRDRQRDRSRDRSSDSSSCVSRDRSKDRERGRDRERDRSRERGRCRREKERHRDEDRRERKKRRSERKDKRKRRSRSSSDDENDQQDKNKDDVVNVISNDNVDSGDKCLEN